MKVTGAVVRVKAFGVALAWPMLPLVSGLQLGAATTVRSIHLPALDAVLVNIFSKVPRPHERMVRNTA